MSSKTRFSPLSPRLNSRIYKVSPMTQVFPSPATFFLPFPSHLDIYPIECFPWFSDLQILPIIHLQKNYPVAGISSAICTSTPFLAGSSRAPFPPMREGEEPWFGRKEHGKGARIARRWLLIATALMFGSISWPRYKVKGRTVPRIIAQ